MNKKKLMLYIQSNSGFYRFANLSAHSLKQLQVIKEKIDFEKKIGGKGKVGTKDK
jgi:hypothetical protein